MVDLVDSYVLQEVAAADLVDSSDLWEVVVDMRQFHNFYCHWTLYKNSLSLHTHTIPSFVVWWRLVRKVGSNARQLVWFVGS